MQARRLAGQGKKEQAVITGSLQAKQEAVLAVIVALLLLQKNGESCD